MRQKVRTDDNGRRKAAVARTPKARPRVAHVVLIGFGGAAAAAVVGAWMMLAAGPQPASAALVKPQARFAVAALTPVDTVPVETQTGTGTVTDIMDFRPAGTLTEGRAWMFAAPVVALARPSAGPETAASPATEETPDEEKVASVPLPVANPLAAEQGSGDDFTLKGPAEPMAVAPLPLKNPLGDRGEAVAALPPPSPPQQPGPSPSDEPELNAELTLPGRGDRYAVYDIRAKTVYMPGGAKLEAHSGLGEMFDDPRHIKVKMRGPTPPNVYDLKMREALFHGVEALRMTPVDDAKMYGRDGILAHSYLLGPRGDSNGCVSFKEYDKFLAAYKRGEVTRIVVVEEMPNSSPARNLFSWLKL
ncbi:MAG: hypothetical protein K0R27_3305 [Xanthobacteraceae bacterium]|jgi:hypothetical protein|nr:hypothetical protein [Xanthobacteraceae bacterium]